MIDLYVRLVESGKRTLDEVPEEYRAEVKAKVNVQTAN